MLLLGRKFVIISTIILQGCINEPSSNDNASETTVGTSGDLPGDDILIDRTNIPSDESNKLADLQFEIFKNGAKSEYETESDYLNRTKNINHEIQGKYGIEFQVKVNLRDYLKYDAEKGILQYRNKYTDPNRVFIKTRNFEGVSIYHYIYFVTCKNGRDFELSPEDAKKVKESSSIEYFVTGELDMFSGRYQRPKRSFLEMRYKNVYGFSYTAFDDSLTFESNFNPSEFTIFDNSVGTVIASNEC